MHCVRERERVYRREEETKREAIPQQRQSWLHVHSAALVQVLLVFCVIRLLVGDKP